MVGKLILNPRYLIFHIYEARYTGLLQTARLSSTGKVLSVPLNAIMDVSVESGIRARSSRPNWKNREDFEKKSSGRRSINSHPAFFDDSERYSMLLVTVETANGVEIARFEVQDPEVWEQTLRNHIAKSPN